MQTLDRPTEQPGGRRPRSSVGLAVLAAVVTVPVLVLLVMSKWGVLVAVLVAATAGLGIWVLRRGFVFIEVVAFLIHFDGLGAGPIRMGRIVAAVAVLVIIHKLVVERWRPPAIPTRHWAPVLLLTVYAVLSGAWADKAGGWFFAMGLLGLALAFFGVSGLLVDSHEKIMQYLRAYWYGGLFGSGAGVLALFLGTRSVGFGGDPNFFGLLQASMIPLTVYYRRNETDPVKRRWYALALMFVLAGAAGAGSRSGLIGGSIAIVGTMVTRPGLSPVRRLRVSVAALLLAGVGFGVGFIANPANLQRGFADRGAGRLDLWTTTVSLIRQQPVFGYGFGQLSAKIPQNLAVTPGVQALIDNRQAVSAHNTWLDILGDLGVVGLIVWTSIFVIAVVGFLRPRWRQTKDISTTLAVMMLPVLSSSNFLPLINNKLSWSLIGLAAALQVPSWGTRWRGFAAAGRLGLPPGPAVAPDPVLDRVGGAAPVRVRADTAADRGGGDRSGGADPREPAWESPVLARWDLRISRRFRYWVLAGAAVGMLLFGAVMSSVPTRYVASGGLILPKVDQTRGNNRIVFSATQMQVIHTLATSGAYAQELQRLSGIDLTVPEVRDRVTVDRLEFGAYMEIRFTDNDPAVVRRALPYVLVALDNLVADSRRFADAQVADELRPVNPGEQRYYTSELYLPAYGDPAMSDQAPRVAWAAFIGALTGMLAATGFMLAQQRRPRVNNDDDLPSAVGLWVWTHVGRAGRRYAATRDQYAQVMTVAQYLTPPDRVPRRIVVATPRPDRAARGLAMGVAGALASEGRRVVLVDGQVDHRLLSLRLGGRFHRGLMEAVTGTDPVESVVRRIHRWRLPVSVRRFTRGRTDLLRFIPAGRLRGDRRPQLRPDVLDRFGPDVTVVLLAPALTSDVSAGPLLAWADTVVLALVEGRTVTFDAEDAAAQVRTFVAAPAGVVLLDV